MAGLKKYKIEIELCAPDHATDEDILEYISSLTRESDLAAINDVFAVGNIEITDEEAITIEQWNGDPVDEIDVEGLL